MTLDQKIKTYLSHLWDDHFPKLKQCEWCCQTGRLRWHGSYLRTLITLNRTYTIPIRRLLCSVCHHTFGFFPSFVEKFHRYAKKIIRVALNLLKYHTYDAVATWFMDHGPLEIDPPTLHLWRQKFS